MDLIISFFRDIDGILYYVILVVNTILIFAIIGYLGDKNNEKILQMSMNTNGVNPSNQPINNNTTPNVNNSNNHGGLAIPKVAPTQANVASNPQPVASIQNTQLNNSVNNNASIATPGNNIPVNNTINSSVPNNQTVQSQQALQGNIANQPPIIRPEDNEVDPNEKAPAVLIINSNNNDKDIK